MSELYSEYEQNSNKSGAGGEEANTPHKLKLSIDLASVRNMTTAANIIVAYEIKLKEVHSFSSSMPEKNYNVQQPPTAVSAQKGIDTQLANTFASYDFSASKSQLFSILNEGNLQVHVIHQVQGGQQSEIGQATLPLSKILSAPLKETPESKVRAFDGHADIKDPQTGHLKGQIRVLLYLEDHGPLKGAPLGSLQQARDQKTNVSGMSAQAPSAGGGTQTGPGGVDYQAVWQLEMWKRAEEAKFKAYLKQREIEKIEEITFSWKLKESDRESTFNEALRGMENLETKMRQRALDLQRREERIIQLEEELKHKITEVSRSLASKEEEVLNIKKRFKEEKSQLEHEKKRQQVQIDDLKKKLDLADAKFYAYKQEIEQSPLSVLRQELATKSIEVVELETKVNNANEQRDDHRAKYEQLKKDMVLMKKQIDREKELTLTKQAEELEAIKKQMRTNAQQQQEQKEFAGLKQQLASLQDKLSDSQRQQQLDDSQQGINPFATVHQSKNKYLDNFTAQASLAGAGQSLNTPTYAAHGTQSGARTNGQKGPPLQTSPQKAPKTELQRLQAERDELLSAGCYTLDDPLIQEMGRQIQAIELRMKQSMMMN